MGLPLSRPRNSSGWKKPEHVQLRSNWPRLLRVAEPFFGLIAAGAQATYGWLARTPPAAGLVSKLETALRRVGYCHRMASPALIRLIMGHPADVLFQSGAAATTAILRTLRRTQCIFSDWMGTGGPAHRVRKLLKSLGWVVVQPWEWRHPSFNFHRPLGLMTLSGLSIFCGKLVGGIVGQDTCVHVVIKLLSLVLDLAQNCFGAYANSGWQS